MFGQTFDYSDLATIALLVLLEGVLSIDNALVLGLLAMRCPRSMQRKALSYGLIGALVFRIVAILLAAYLLRWRAVKLLGGLYLVYIGAKHLILGSAEQKHHPAGPAPAADANASETSVSGFWPTVVAIELTDIAFAVDSILAAIALVGGPPPGTPRNAAHPKLWVVVVGGMLGVVLMRFAAIVFIKLLERFPRFEMAAYLLVVVIGAKLLADWAFNGPGHTRLDFHDYHSIAFWVFWGLMVLCFAAGFLPRHQVTPIEQEVAD